MVMIGKSMRTHLISNSEPPEPGWLRNILGDDFFSSVVVVNDSTRASTDAGLEHLKELAQLRCWSSAAPRSRTPGWNTSKI